MKRKRIGLLGAGMTVLTGAALTVLGLGSTTASAAPLPGGLGPCAGPACPGSAQNPNNGPVAGYDENINVFVGGDFRVGGSAAEAEGKIVTLGDFSMNKTSGSSVYNVGVVGVGSRVPPPNGSDFLTVGGDLTVADGQRLLAEEGSISGKVTYAGERSGRTEPDAVHAPDAAAPYAGLRGALTTSSGCYAHVAGGARPATGTAVNQGHQTLFRGDGSSRLQVFNVDFDLVSPSGGDQGMAFEGIPEGATVLVNMLGDSRTISSYVGHDVGPDGLRERLLWNFPDASSITIKGSAQFQGAVLVGSPRSTTKVSVPGMNGRFYTAGSLDHTASSGAEFHGYPFTGDLPSCGTPPTPTPTPTPTGPTTEPTGPTDPTGPTEPGEPSPTETTPTTGPTAPTVEPSASVTGPTGAPVGTADPTAPAGAGGASSAGGSGGGESDDGQLALTGALGNPWVMGAAAFAIAVGTALTVLVRRRRLG
ncbi:choice-of-anchor A family protein [Streptomyces sp. 71268]|uniref:choice-of-anchor A family protein n=1 Tax=Streptomyces sp. 71268 TaxID=3002640 RepID=UPI0023F751AF|nr:choice-of-anchor A family protein [Streptomyces sp. 71268]WEV29397.1 choice-of-anchor A family protein [Streptomyces sp. 71268]